jgi:hypothetical protein
MSSCRAQTLIAFLISDVEIHALVAAIGSVVATELEALEVRGNITPRDKTFFMKPLVRELAALLG